MGNVIDIAGVKFGRLTALSISGFNDEGKAMWKCKCDCGRIKTVCGCNLRNGGTKSCGCYQSEIRSEIRKKYNQISIKGDIAIIYLESGEEVIIDSDCVDIVKNIRWCKDKMGYVKGEMNGKKVRLHRLITGAPSGLYVDHKNHCTLDNRKENLRVCTPSQNSMNKIVTVNKSGTVGVRKTRGGKWVSQIKANRKYVYLGTYENYEDAVNARKEAEKRYFGEFAYKEGK
jgi:hypothetical protein